MVSEPKAKRGSRKPAEIKPELVSYDRASVAAILSIHTRTLDRMVASEEFPPRDFLIKNSPRWKAATVLGWIESQARKSR